MPPEMLFDISQMDTDKTVVTKDEIYQVNPHRHEFALLDGLFHLDLEELTVGAYVDIRPDAYWVRGHIPGRPIFPGVLMIESAAQMVGYIVKVYTKVDGFVGFGAVTDVKFRAAVVPGDRLLILGKMIEIRGRRRAIGLAQGFVNGKMAFEACVTGVMV